MKVISILQPFATLVILGYKRIETRSWNTKYRGPILIHASAGKKEVNREIMLDFQQEFSHLNLPRYRDLPFGAIIGKVNLMHTVQSEYCFDGNEFEITDTSKTGYPVSKFILTKQELSFGDYTEGRYGWLFSDPVQFANPIQAKGSLSIWNYDMPDHIHIPIEGGGHSTFSSPPDKETLDAVNAMVELAKKKI